jgi:hypothetical protein
VRQRLAPVEADHPRRVRERRDAREQLRLDVLARTKELDRFDARVVGRLHEVLALDNEQPLLLALPPRVEQAPHQPQRRVGRRSDHSHQSSQAPW